MRGAIHAIKKAPDLAIADYTKAIELEPRNAGYYSSRASSYSKKNDHERALADYNKAIELEPADWLNYYFRCWLYKTMGKRSLAEADLRKAKELDKDKEMRKLHFPAELKLIELPPR